MQVKKFEAPTMAEALNLVKAELGPEAIILSTKNHRKGFGLLSKASVEVTAAVTDKSLGKKHITEKIVPKPTRDQIDKLTASKQAQIYEEFTGYYQKRKNERNDRVERAEQKAEQRAEQKAEQRAEHRAERTERLERKMEQNNYTEGRMPDRSGTSALMGGASSQSQNVRVGGGGGTFAAGANASAPSTAQASSRTAGRVSGPPRYIDITDDGDDEAAAPAAQNAYSRNGRVPSAVHADSQSERIASRGGMSAGSPMGRPYQQREVPDYSVNAQIDARAENLSRELEGPGHVEVSALQEDIQRLKSMLEELKSEQLSMNDAKLPEVSSEEIQSEYNNLLRNGIDKRYATALIKQVAFTLSREGLQRPEAITEALAVEMMNNVKIDNPLDFKAGSERRVYALIGPTGVGKTTTIAKLASQAILNKNLRVGLINVDSYKVAALDQLATYAKILNVPFRQASTAAELDRALTEFKPLDLVLIDTSGRSQRDSESLSQMKLLLSECTSVRPILIMSATTRDQELYDIITRFKLFNPTGLVFSKLDETSTFGCIYNISVKTGLPLSYFTVGQRVPEDIESASRERVADLILDL